MNDDVEIERQFLQLWAAVSGHLSPKRRGEIIKTIFMSGLERVGHLYGLDVRQMTVDLDLVHETLKLDKNGRRKRVRTTTDVTIKKPRKQAEKTIVITKTAELVEKDAPAAKPIKTLKQKPITESNKSAADATIKTAEIKAIDTPIENAPSAHEKTRDNPQPKNRLLEMF